MNVDDARFLSALALAGPYVLQKGTIVEYRVRSPREQSASFLWSVEEASAGDGKVVKGPDGRPVVEAARVSFQGDTVRMEPLARFAGAEPPGVEALLKCEAARLACAEFLRTRSLTRAFGVSVRTDKADVFSVIVGPSPGVPDGAGVFSATYRDGRFWLEDHSYR